MELEGIFVQIGLLPDTDWLKGTVALSARGGIEVGTLGQGEGQKAGVAYRMKDGSIVYVPEVEGQAAR